MVPFPQSLGAACRQCGIVQLLPSQSPALSQGLRMTRLMTAAVLLSGFAQFCFAFCRYLCTQVSLGLAQTSRPFFVMNLWNRDETREVSAQTKLPGLGYCRRFSLVSQACAMADSDFPPFPSAFSHYRNIPGSPHKRFVGSPCRSIPSRSLHMSTHVPKWLCLRCTQASALIPTRGLAGSSWCW